MKKILVTGAGGTIGIKCIEYLIKEENYEISALDLKSTKTVNRLKKHRKRINIIYGDINDETLITALVKEHDIIIHLAGIIPPFADIKESLSRIVDYEGTKNIVKKIKKYHPNCFLIYASSTTVYGNIASNENISIETETNVDIDDNYSMAKIRAEETIRENLKNYTIFRLPAVIGNLRYDAPMYNIPENSKVEFITDHNVALAFVKAINKQKELNKKTFNATGGEEYRTTFKEFLCRVLKIHGLSFRFLATKLLIDKNFYSGYYSDGDKLNDILDFRSGSLEEYYQKEQKQNANFKYTITRILAKPFLIRLKKKNKEQVL